MALIGPHRSESSATQRDQIQHETPTRSLALEDHASRVANVSRDCTRAEPLTSPALEDSRQVRQQEVDKLV